MINFTLKIRWEKKIMNKNADKQQREIKKAMDTLIKSGYKVNVLDFTKEESHGKIRVFEKE